MIGEPNIVFGDEELMSRVVHFEAANDQQHRFATSAADFGCQVLIGVHVDVVSFHFLKSAFANELDELSWCPETKKFRWRGLLVSKIKFY